MYEGNLEIGKECLIILSGVANKDDFQWKHCANLYDVAGKEYVQNKVKITHA